MSDFEDSSGKKAERFPTEQVLLRNFIELFKSTQEFVRRVGRSDKKSSELLRALEELHERALEGEEAVEVLVEVLEHPERGEEYARPQSEGARQSYRALEEALRKAKEAFNVPDNDPDSGPQAA